MSMVVSTDCRGPKVRWDRVLRASSNQANSSRPDNFPYVYCPVTTVPLVRRSQPSRSVSDQYRLSGAWFHSHTVSSREPLGAISAAVGYSVVTAWPMMDTSSMRYSTVDDAGCGLPHGV